MDYEKDISVETTEFERFSREVCNEYKSGQPH